MRFPPEFLDEIKVRLPVSEVVGRRVKLRKSGREWRGLSPFNAEKTPSFFVNDGKMAWFDFSSGKNGNIFDFVIETEGLSFPEAVERLANEAGLLVPQRTPESQVQDQRRASLHEVLEKAAAFFATRLAAKEGERARRYLADRQVTSTSVTAFRIGFAPAERHALRDHLASVGASVDTMIEAGLLIHGDDIKVPYDRFRDRVMFPICDRSGRVIAFGGRALDKDVAAKYLNSPETPLFHKGAVLFNHHQARKPAADRARLIAVEGYLDVVAMTAVGFPETVAPLGTALTADQCGLLWRMSEEPTLCFDGDGAGRRAAFRAVETALPLVGPGRSMRFAFMPDGQDPDDLARTGGATAVAEVIDKARPLVDMLWLRETDGVTLETPEQRAAVERRLNEAVASIGDEPLRRHYGAAMRERLRALLGPARPQGGAPGRPVSGSAWSGERRRGKPGPPPLRGYVGVGLPPSSTSFARSSALTRVAIPQREAAILVLILAHPDLLDRHFDAIAHLEFTNAETQRLRDAIVHLVGEALHDRGTLRHALEQRGFDSVRAHIEQTAEKLQSGSSSDASTLEAADRALRQAMALHQKTQALHKDLRAAEHALASEGNDLNFALLREIRSRVTGLNGMEASVDRDGAGSNLPESNN